MEDILLQTITIEGKKVGIYATDFSDNGEPAWTCKRYRFRIDGRKETQVWHSETDCIISAILYIKKIGHREVFIQMINNYIKEP